MTWITKFPRNICNWTLVSEIRIAWIDTNDFCRKLFGQHINWVDMNISIKIWYMYCKKISSCCRLFFFFTCMSVCACMNEFRIQSLLHFCHHKFWLLIWNTIWLDYVSHVCTFFSYGISFASCILYIRFFLVRKRKPVLVIYAYEMLLLMIKYMFEIVKATHITYLCPCVISFEIFDYITVVTFLKWCKIIYMCLLLRMPFFS